MTPERLAALCGLLPEWEFTEETFIERTASEYREPFRFDNEVHADHLLMEALRAVEKRGLRVQIDFGKPAHVRLFRRWDLPPIATGDDPNPLNALLDAVREAGL